MDVAVKYPVLNINILDFILKVVVYQKALITH